MKWMDIAWAQEGAGVEEIGGPRANASIVGYFAKIGRPDIVSDEVPWCAAAYFWCLQEAGIDISSIAPKDRLLAYSATKLGQRISEPRVGCGCVMKRDGGHHVGFVKSWTATTVTLVGGNQADAFNHRTFKRQPNMIWIWPETVTAKQLDQCGSRITTGAKRVTKDTAKGGATQILPPPPAFPDQPLPLPDLPALPAPEAVLGKAQLFQGQVETAMQFSTFLAGRWSWVMLAIAAYYGLRAIWTSNLIRKWRAEDASTGKTVAAGEAVPGDVVSDEVSA